MLIVFHQNASPDQIRTAEERLNADNTAFHAISIGARTVFLADGHCPATAYADVAEAFDAPQAPILATRVFQPETTVVRVKNAVIGGQSLALMAGPCAVESERQLMTTAQTAQKAGALILRGGVFKPRTSPYSFQGLGLDGLKLLRMAGDTFGMALVTEVVDEQSLAQACEYVDMIQIGARSMQHFSLLRAAGKSGLPVVLKRGPASTLEEWLSAAEYVLCEGNDQVILCERGVRTPAPATRGTLDVAAIARLRTLSHLPVIADPSHAAGDSSLVIPLALSAVAAGADGLMVEVHPEPETALSDGGQSLTFDAFAFLCDKLRAVAPAVGRSF